MPRRHTSRLSPTPQRDADTGPRLSETHWATKQILAHQAVPVPRPRRDQTEATAPGENRAQQRSVAIVFRLERSLYSDTDLGGLICLQFGQFHADLFQMQARHLFVEVLGQDINAGRIIGALGPKLDLGQHLVGEAG